MTAKYGNFAAPATEAVAIVASDGLTIEPTRAIYVGASGNVNVRMAQGPNVSCVFLGVPAGTILPVSVTEVYATSTTATSMVALR